jgi:hypothetical protein
MPGYCAPWPGNRNAGFGGDAAAVSALPGPPSFSIKPRLSLTTAANRLAKPRLPVCKVKAMSPMLCSACVSTCAARRARASAKALSSRADRTNAVLKAEFRVCGLEMKRHWQAFMFERKNGFD